MEAALAAFLLLKAENQMNSQKGGPKFYKQSHK